ncbi:protein translocase subunit SecD [Vibrio alfacsensis]|uniref:protein translocase subunit SecD n=1 Tax=Vibrio alfacsensis TaxID=1074311 RepID=UPI002ADD6682|nr:protein translocase subunit SecD [Vibrio alfacsensis]WQE78052.1 protein translocase subunit SecD [Vibrio alfacsensis]
MRKNNMAISSAKIKDRGNLNRLSKWKYAFLLLMLATLLLQAIPTLYGDVPAVGIRAQAGSQIVADDIKNILDIKGIVALDIDQQDDVKIISFDTIEAQQRAKQALDRALGDGAEVTVQYQSTAPKWFKTIGAEPVKLGLDLRGGVQLLLFVDLDGVFNKHTDAMVSEIRKLLREDRVRDVKVRKLTDAQIKLVGTDSAIQKLLSSEAARQWSNWQIRADESGALITLTEDERLILVRSAMSQNITILRDRISELGIAEASVQRQGRDHIRIELPGLYDPKQAKSVIGATASLSFYEAREEGPLSILDQQGRVVNLLRQPVLSGEHIVDARSGADEMGRPQVSIKLDASGGDKMSRFSRNNIGQQMATVYTEYVLNPDGKLIPKDEVINVATIQSTLGNSFRITGIDSSSGANELALLLRSGALTAPVQIVEERAIGPTLGEQNIQAGISALALGFAGMAVFLITWYRRFGWVAIVGLSANLVMQVGFLVLLPGAVLTLPGIAGLVLTVGMAVDTNVLIFERIRDRLREGASLAVSIDFGYRSAFVTIFDANITTLISALCLYGIGSGPLQGFATTLILGLISSMVCGIWVTRALINPIWGRDTRRMVKI